MTNAGASTGVCIDGEDVVVDAILCAEHAFLEVRDVKVARRHHDLAERREEKSATAAVKRGPSVIWVEVSNKAFDLLILVILHLLASKAPVGAWSPESCKVITVEALFDRKRCNVRLMLRAAWSARAPLVG